MASRATKEMLNVIFGMELAQCGIVNLSWISMDEHRFQSYSCNPVTKFPHAEYLETPQKNQSVVGDCLAILSAFIGISKQSRFPIYSRQDKLR